MRGDSARELVALILVGAVATIAFTTVAPDAPAATPREPLLQLVASNSAACSLTPQEEQKAVETFHEKLMPVLMHPRCFNCHGGVDPTKKGGGHVGGVMQVNHTANECTECHGEREGWNLPQFPTSNWIGKDERELCMTFKNIESSPAAFVRHVTHDDFPNDPKFQLVVSAFKGDRALDADGRRYYEAETGQKFRLEPPPVSHAQFILDSRDWAFTIGDGWKVLPDCGCKVRQSAWEGTVEATYTERGTQLGLLIETTKSTIRLELDTAMTNETDAYWQSTAGAIRWSVTMTGGECTASAEGTVPMGLGADLNPMATIQIGPDIAGVKGYSVSIGPWPDAYTPRFPWKCASKPTIRPGMAYTLNSWWEIGGRMPLGAVGKTMKGSYKMALGVGEMVWLWNLKYVEGR
jgi:hypothetical protein